MHISKISSQYRSYFPRTVFPKLFAGFLFLCCFIGGGAITMHAGSGTCGSFYLRNSSGEVINPLTGENGHQPFSTRQTCGTCHEYETITKGFHFQQGWEKVSDNFNVNMPWVLSDGMMGKH